MGFSSVVGATVMVIALLICGAYLYTTVDSHYETIYNAHESYYSHLNDKLHEKLVITNVKSSASQTNITIYNNGSVVVEPRKFSVLFNGSVVPEENISYYPQKDYLVPLDNITIIVNWPTPNRICIISDNGNKYFYSLS
ncbi:flagellar protein F [Methanocaldococcus fervens]|uniref:Flagellin n=1 Tax=Methanocaldococcus fervens (strain DSM 4213 / JCM 15782 / AG86) TaxID=573064 RepID=C7P8Y6_METFA|nr:flagellar protein F [Methanocaldococcus fervens]ACV25018.1 flagellin [Methanocaldococcus fervens AG86]